MDRLPKTKQGNTCAIILQDPFDDFAKIIPAKTKKAEETAYLIWEHWLTDPIGGFPQILQHDAHKTFLSDVIKCLREMFDIKASVSAAGSHGKTSKVERTIRTFNNMLSKMISEDQTDWDIRSNAVWKAHAMCISSSTGYSPIYMRTLMHPRLPELIPYSERTPDKMYTKPKRYVDEMTKIFNEIIKNSITYRQHIADQKQKLLLKPRLPQVHEYEALQVGQKVNRLNVASIKPGGKKKKRNTNATSAESPDISNQSSPGLDSEADSKPKEKLGTFWEGGYTVLAKVNALTYKLGYSRTTKTGKTHQKTVVVHRKHIRPTLSTEE